MRQESPERLALGLATGAAFGAVLQRSGVTRYDVITDQLLLRDHHVAHVMAGGAAVGAVGTEADARRLGAHDFVVTKGPGLDRLARQLDVIVDTVSAPHDDDQYLALLRPRGARVLVGAPREPSPLSAFALILGGKRMVVELIPIPRMNEAHERVLRSDVRHRFVIDAASLAPPRGGRPAARDGRPKRLRHAPRASA